MAKKSSLVEMWLELDQRLVMMISRVFLSESISFRCYSGGLQLVAEIRVIHGVD